MPIPVPTVANIEEYIQHVEETVITAVSSATPDLPNVKHALNRLWEDVSRFGPKNLPSLPDIKIKSLGPFEVPAPPPPPPPPQGWLDRSADWCGEHPWKAAGLIGVGVVGAGLFVGYRTSFHKAEAKSRKMKAASNTERRQVVVVLGGDHPLGLPLILDLESKGYIVITSTSTPEAAEDVESKTHGYVRALVLDPTEHTTIPYFLRSLASTMSRRFPITSSGDPHTSPSTQPYLYSIISLLTLPPPTSSSSLSPPPGPLETLDLTSTYPSYLQHTHMTPLQITQALLPLLRANPARTQDRPNEKKSIIFCVPSVEARVGLAFGGARAMSAAATVRGAEVLRREIAVASLSDKTGGMKAIKVVLVDVGAVGQTYTLAEKEGDVDPSKAMMDWTASEKAAYGGAFESAFTTPGAGFGARKPTHVSKFVGVVSDIVSGNRACANGWMGVCVWAGRLREYIYGERIVVGAGARTYALASSLPALILDALLSLPHLLLSIRNALLPVPSRLPYPPPILPTTRAPPSGYISTQGATVRTASTSTIHPPPPSTVETESEFENSGSGSASGNETGSEADVESNEEGEYTSAVSESWVSLPAGMRNSVVGEPERAWREEQ